MHKRLLTCALIMLVQIFCAGPLQAQSSNANADASTASVKRDIYRLSTNGKRLVHVRLRDGRKLKGYVSQPGEDNFILTDKEGQKNTIAYADVIKAKKGGGLSRTSKVLIGAGVAVGVGVTVLAIAFSHMHVGRL